MAQFHWTRREVLKAGAAAMALPVLGTAGIAPGADPVADAQPRQRPLLVAQLGSSHVWAAAFSANGRQVVTAGTDQTARLWDAATGRELRTFAGHAAGLCSAAFSPDGRQVLTGGWDKSARLWDAATGKEIRRFEGHGNAICSVAFSPDGRQVLTGSWDNSARLWDAATGKELRRFVGHTDHCVAVAFSPDGRQVLTGSWDKTARLWDAATGERLRRLEGHGSRVEAVAFSPDGRQALTGSADETARLWDAASGKEVRRFEGHAGSVFCVAFSPDGRLVLTGDWKHTARLWDAATGKEVCLFAGHADRVQSVAFSPDGQQVLTASWDETARLWDAATGREVRKFVGRTSDVNAVAFSRDGRQVLTGNWDNTARLWDAASGKEVRRFVGHLKSVAAVAFSPDGRQVLTGSDDRMARLWDAATGKELRRFTGGDEAVQAVAFSPDGRQVLIGSEDCAARLWDAATGKIIHRFAGPGDQVFFVCVAFSPDGRHVLTGSWDHAARLWDAATGKEVRSFVGHSEWVHAVAFSPDGRQVLTGSDDRTVRLWDAATGKLIRKLEGSSGGLLSAVFPDLLPDAFSGITSVAFSPDGRRILAGTWDKMAILWDAATGKQLRRLQGHVAPVGAVAFSPDGRRALTGSLDNTSRLWDPATGEELCRLLSFRDGTWAVVDAEGRFDAANGGDVEGLHWVLGDEPIDLRQLKDRYYEPGLLAKITGFNAEPLRKVDAFRDPRLYPEVQASVLPPENRSLLVQLTNRGGGIGRVVVLVNGKEVTADARSPGVNPDAPEVSLTIDLSGDPRLKPGQENAVEIQAYNAEGYLRSRGLQVLYTPPGTQEAAVPHLWGIIVGVSRYRAAQIDLHFPAKDAQDFAAALQTGASRLLGPQQVHVTALTTDAVEPSGQPTRANLLRALAAAAEQARPGDLLVLYLAGHGVNFGGQDGDYYFLTCEAATADLTDPEIRRQTAVSSAELTEVVKRVPAQKQVLVLDTCASGRLVERITEKREVPSSQVRAIERMKDRTGLHILAGCAADRVSYEASRYAQGLLTYSLLLGMRGAALREQEFVDVALLMRFATDEVENLAKDVGGVQRPVVSVPWGGQTFDIGRLTAEDKAKIPLQQVRPLVLRAAFHDEVRVRDTLDLTRLVNQELQDCSSRGRGAPLVFVDAAEMPGAYELAGLYRVEGDKVVVKVVVTREDKEQPAFEVSGQRMDLGKLAAEIVRRFQERLGK